MDVTIDRDIPESYNLYISPVGIAKINGLQFYGGLQTNVNGWASKKVELECIRVAVPSFLAGLMISGNR